jgi:hypothetical protein
MSPDSHKPQLLEPLGAYPPLFWWPAYRVFQTLKNHISVGATISVGLQRRTRGSMRGIVGEDELAFRGHANDARDSVEQSSREFEQTLELAPVGWQRLKLPHPKEVIQYGRCHPLFLLPLAWACEAPQQQRDASAASDPQIPSRCTGLPVPGVPVASPLTEVPP